jgi:hypothetical protein
MIAGTIAAASLESGRAGLAWFAFWPILALSAALAAALEVLDGHWR